MLLTVNDDIDAVFIFRLLKEPEPPCTLLTVKQDNTAQPAYRVLTFAEEIDALMFTKVLTSKVDTERLGKYVLLKFTPVILLTFSDDIDAVFIFRLLKEPDPPCIVLTCKLDTIRLGKYPLSNVMPSMLLTVNDDMEAVFIFRLLKEP